MSKKALNRKEKSPLKKTTIETAFGFKIRMRPDRGTYVLQVRRQGLNHFETFATVEAARDKAKQLHDEQAEHGLSAFKIDAKARGDANEAMKVLAGRASLVEAAKVWLMYHPQDDALTVAQLAEQYLADMERRKCRPVTITGARNRLNLFSRTFGQRPAGAIAERDITGWLDKHGGAAQNRNNHRAVIRALFNFGIKRGAIASNPADKIETVKRDEVIPGIWPVEKVESLLRAAERMRPDTTPALAILAFCGMRPDEVARLDWSSVNLSERFVRVMPHTSKLRKARLVDLPANAVKWLAPHHRTKGPVALPYGTFITWRTRIAAVSVLGADVIENRLAKHEGKRGTDIKREGLTWKQFIAEAKKTAGELWPVDILRHSYASHWLAVNNDAAKLAELMGNSIPVVRRHYLGLVKPNDGAKYFAIQPSRGKIIRLKSVA